MEASDDANSERMEGSGEPSKGNRKRGRPPQPSEGDRNSRKRVTDKQSRQENREVIVGLTKIAPVLKQLVEAVSNNNLSEDAIERFKEVAPALSQLEESLRQSNPGELMIQIRQSAQETKDAVTELREVVPLLQLLQNDGQNLTQNLKAVIDGSVASAMAHVVPQIVSLVNGCQTMVVIPNNQHITEAAEATAFAKQVMAPVMPEHDTTVTMPNDQNIIQTDQGMPLVEQQNNESDLLLTDEYQNESIVGMVANLRSSSSPTAHFMENLATSEPITEISNNSDQNGESFDDEQVNDFFEQCDGNGNVKRQVQYSDFNGLEEELGKLGHNHFPSSLAPIAKKIKEAHGNITETSNQSDCAAYPTIIMFYASIKEMNELKDLEDVSESKLGKWRDVILDAQQIKLNVQFAMVHLKKIALAYFGSKASDSKLSDKEKRLKAELDAVRKKVQLRQQCLDQAAYFSDKPLNTDLF
ncbi:uncharacterized protein LOC111290670 [Durio zibethinus]|uniref:Uncharacterized protein LOC111290670 n=1 Tax=Durio zibethinus TaxID=66656 RepID=A0A6P5YBX4_DURZI|nr:uncharacterized protein LOC111290670 [Durio zibethinus]